MSQLDAIDRKILAAVQSDVSRSSAELAAVVGISASPCWRRLQRLKEAGYIKAQVAHLDREKLGLTTLVFAQVKLSAAGRRHFDKIATAVRGLPEVLECYVLMGPMDLMLKIATTDVQAYERLFFEKLSTLDGVEDISSIVALSEVKATTALPIR